MSIVDIFPTPIGIYELDRNFADSEIKFIENLQWEEHIGNYGSVNTNLLDQEEFANLRLFIEKKLKDYLDKTVSPIDNNEFYITQSWANITKPGQFHHGHVHQNSLISGVLYINAEKGKDGIVFTNGESNYERIYLDKKEHNIYNSVKRFIDVKTGDLVLFPSELEHQVEVTSSNSDRISVAFNTFVKGDLGFKNFYCGLKL